MNILLALFLLVHAVSHLVGFVVPWKLTEIPEAPYKTTILKGTVDLGDSGIRIFGLIWLLAAFGFGASAVLLFLEPGVWLPFTTLITVVSLILSVLAWPASKVGIPANILILAVLLARHSGWF